MKVQQDQQINIILKTEEGQKIISSYIREVYPDRLVLTQPQNWETYLSYLEEGEEIDTKVLTRAGVFLYTSVILNSPVDDCFTIEYNENSAKLLQRRAYTRVKMDTIVDCEYDVLDKNEKSANQNIYGNMVQFSTSLSCKFEKFTVEAETIDMGGGGLKIKAVSELPLKTPITFCINLFDDIIVAQGVIVENNKLPEKQYGIMFTKISDEDREKIIKTCVQIDGILNRK